MSRELIVLDIDRTLINTTHLSAVIAKPIAAALRLSDAQVAMMQAAIGEREGKVFDYLAWLPEAMELDARQRALLDDADALTRALLKSYSVDGQLSAEFIENILISGAPELFAAIHSSGARALLLTAGGKVLQSIKVALIQAMARQLAVSVALTDAVVIAANVPKAELIEACFGSNGFSTDALQDQALVFSIENPSDYRAIRHATIIDDKYENLLPQSNHVSGIPVYIEGDRAKSEADETHYRAFGLPARQSLHQVAENLSL